MCELCTPYGASYHVPEDTRSTTPEDAGTYERWRGEREERYDPAGPDELGEDPR